MIRRLRLKFIGISMGLVAAVLLVMFALVYGMTERNLERESVRMMLSVASEPVGPARPGEDRDRVRLPYAVIELGPEGEVRAFRGGEGILDESEAAELAREALASGEKVGVLEERGLRYCLTRGRFGESLVLADISSERATLAGLVRTCLLIGAASLAAFFAVSVILARWAVRPVERAWEQQRQFVADASHELKTPLTVILTNAELLTSPGAGAEDRERYAFNILTMGRQMRGLVGGLLELARVENADSHRELEAVDMTALVEDGALPFEPMFFERGLELITAAEPGVKVRGSGEQLRRVLEILLDNALKYSTSPGTVRVELARQGRRCLLTVSSPGEEMSKRELSDIFKRFYRSDRARTMDGSYGLGLAIARQIVTGHGGRIWARSEGGVNRFFVELGEG